MLTVEALEVVMKNRDPRDAWAFAQRICDVCTAVHALGSILAVEDAVSYPVPEQAQLIRRLISMMQILQDHVIHFYHLQALDWVDVVSALSADPADTANLQTSLSPAFVTMTTSGGMKHRWVFQRFIFTLGDRQQHYAQRFAEISFWRMECLRNRETVH